MLYDEVMLIRCAPNAENRARVRSGLRARPCGGLLVFFHGPGLDWAQDAAARRILPQAGQGATLMICAAGWRRRRADEPPDGWQVGSLVQFWDAADRASRVSSFGALHD